MIPQLPLYRKVRYTKEIWTGDRWRILHQEEKTEPTVPIREHIKQCICGHGKLRHKDYLMIEQDNPLPKGHCYDCDCKHFQLAVDYWTGLNRKILNQYTGGKKRNDKI